jgi:hypothetical protein
MWRLLLYSSTFTSFEKVGMEMGHSFISLLSSSYWISGVEMVNSFSFLLLLDYPVTPLFLSVFPLLEIRCGDIVLLFLFFPPTTTRFAP